MLIKHVRIRPIMVFKCCVCQEEQEDKDELEIHISVEHVFYTPYQCEFCQSALFPSDFSLRRHYLSIFAVIISAIIILVDHRQEVFNVIYRVSPQLEEKRLLAGKLLSQSIANSDGSQAMPKKSAFSIVQKMLPDCANYLRQFVFEDSLEHDATSAFESSKNNQVGDYVKPDKFLQSPSSSPIEDSFSSVVSNSADQAIEQLYNTSKSTSRQSLKRKSSDDKAVLDSMLNKNLPVGQSVTCNKCNCSVANYTNSLYQHISTHHCQHPIFECLGCEKKWYSLSARYREHISSKHEGNMELLRDNREQLKDEIKQKVSFYFPSRRVKIDCSAS